MAVTTEQLLRMRQRSETTFDTTCRIQRTTKARDAQSGRTETVTLTDPIPCRVGQMSQGHEGIFAQQLRGRSGLTVTVAVGIEVDGERIRPSDRVVLADGRELEIVGTNGPHTAQAEQRIYCAETR